MKKIFLLLIAPIFLLLTSRNNLENDTQNVTVISNPSDADVLITEIEGKRSLARLHCLQFKKSDGSYFGVLIMY